MVATDLLFSFKPEIYLLLNHTFVKTTGCMNVVVHILSWIT